MQNGINSASENQTWTNFLHFQIKTS